MRGICRDGPAQGWECVDLPEPVPASLRMPRDIDDYAPGSVPRSIEPGTPFPKMPGIYGYRLDGKGLADHLTVPGAQEAVALYVRDESLDETAEYTPSLETWIYREQPVGLRS